MPPCSRRRGARPPLLRGGGSLSRRVRCVVLGSSRSLRVAVGAVAVVRRSRRRCLRRCAGAPSAGSMVPPRSRRRDARKPLVRGAGSPSRHERCVVLGSSRSLRVTLVAVAVARRSRRRSLRRRTGAPAPACSCRRAHGGVTLGRRSSVVAARPLGAHGASCSAARAPCVWLWWRLPSRGAHGAAPCGAALALQRWLVHAAALAAAWRSTAAALWWRRLALSARAVIVLGSSCSLRVAVGAVAVARRSRRRCLRRRAGAPCAG